MCATEAVGDGATLQPGVDDHRDSPMPECIRIVGLWTVLANSTTSPAMIVSRPWSISSTPTARLFSTRMRRVSAPPAKGWGSGLAEVSGLFHRKISVTLEPITSEQATNGQRCSSYRSGPPSSQGEADREGACKSMNHYLVQANQQIAEL